MAAMRRHGRRRLAALLTAGGALAAAGCHQTDTSDLRRSADPVVLKGSQLPRIAGVDPGEVVAFIRAGSTWTPVPVQVDEFHVANMGVVHNRGTVPATDHLVPSDPDTLTGADPNAAVDNDDEIVFMARDAGRRAPSGAADPAGTIADSGVEVTVTDPAGGGAQGYVYLFRRAPGSDLQPGAGHDNVAYDFVLESGAYPETYDFDGRGTVVGDPPANPPRPANPENSEVRTPAYRTTFADRWINDGLQITIGGASGVDILDRDKHWFVTGPDDPRPGQAPPSCSRNENTFAAGHGALVANIDGPVRAIRSFIGANSAVYTEKRHVFYERRQEVAVYLRGHPGPDAPDAVQDYSDAAIGMTYRNDRNRGGVRIDGVPDTVAQGALRWEQVTGGQGTYTVVHHSTVTDPPPPVITSFYADDATPDFVQCTGDGKAIGTSGVALSGPLGNTDPRRVEEFGGQLYEVTFRRTAYYDPPGGTAADADQRDAWVRTPLTAAAVRWTG
jgi:hypothetical protein